MERWEAFHEEVEAEKNTDRCLACGTLTQGTSCGCAEPAALTTPREGRVT
jgi:hypothetical protein